MLYNLKIIRKKSKPILWHELEVPCGITFSVLSVFLDIATGIKDAPPSEYLFDLPSFAVQLREGIFEDGTNPLYKLALREADTTFINEYMKKGSWFTYRPDRNEDTAFRVEVKEIINRKQEMAFPGKYSRGVFELYEKEDGSSFKERIKEFMNYRVRYDDGFHFMKKAEILDQRGKRNILPEGQIPIELVSTVIVPAMTNPESRPDNTIQSIGEIIRAGAEQVMASLDIQNFRTDDHSSLREMLFAIYHEEDLRRLAGLLGISDDVPGEFLSLFDTEYRKSVASLVLAKRCADRMLEKECMVESLLSMNDRQMETFMRAIKEGGTFKTETFAETDDMAFLCELDYAVPLKKEDMYMIPKDVIEAFREIDTPEFHHRRQQHVWLMDCLEVVEYYYGSIPIRHFYRLYRQFGELDRKKMLDAIRAFDNFETLCTVHDGRIIYNGWLHDDEYKSLESCQGDKDYYIPAKEEVEDISWNGYPSKQKEVKMLLAFFKNEMKMEEFDAEDLTEEVWHTLNQGGGFHDVMDMINEKKMVFPSDKAVQKFAECITNLNNRTPMLYNRGFRPEDLRPIEMEKIRRNGLKVVPGSTQAAGMLAEASAQLRAMGINIDLDSNAREVDTAFISPDRRTVIKGKKKIYPNDPCPCGSGKKYKNCCGRR